MVNGCGALVAVRHARILDVELRLLQQFLLELRAASERHGQAGRQRHNHGLLEIRVPYFRVGDLRGIDRNGILGIGQDDSDGVAIHVRVGCHLEFLRAATKATNDRKSAPSAAGGILRLPAERAHLQASRRIAVFVQPGRRRKGIAPARHRRCAGIFGRARSSLEQG